MPSFNQDSNTVKKFPAEAEDGDEQIREGSMQQMTTFGKDESRSMCASEL